MRCSLREHEIGFVLDIAVPSLFPLCWEYGIQMHVPGPSQDLRMAYSTVVWAAPQLPRYTYYRCMYTFDGVLGCQRASGVVVWDVTFRVLVGEDQRPCWTFLAKSIPTGVEATNGLPGSSLRLCCHWHSPEMFKCRTVLVDTQWFGRRSTRGVGLPRLWARLQ